MLAQREKVAKNIHLDGVFYQIRENFPCVVVLFESGYNSNMDSLFSELESYARRASPFLIKHDNLVDFLLATQEDAQKLSEQGFELQKLNKQLLLSSEPLRHSFEHYYSSQQ